MPSMDVNVSAIRTVGGAGFGELYRGVGRGVPGRYDEPRTRQITEGDLRCVHHRVEAARVPPERRRRAFSDTDDEPRVDPVCQAVGGDRLTPVCEQYTLAVRTPPRNKAERLPHQVGEG